MRHLGRQGFTIVELTMTVVVMAVVMSVGLPQYGRAVETQRRSRAQNTLRLIRQAERVYQSINGTYTATLTNLTTLQNPGGLNNEFSYTVPTATATQLTVVATRNNAPSFLPSNCVTLSINAAGAITDACAAVSTASTTTTTTTVGDQLPGPPGGGTYTSRPGPGDQLPGPPGGGTQNTGL
jgi:prepilin-type N-terminal cleavage/methylation domain-containing protein